MYIKHLFFELRCLGKLLVNDTTLFSVAGKVNKTATNLNKNPENINKWAERLKDIR